MDIDYDICNVHIKICLFSDGVHFIWLPLKRPYKSYPIEKTTFAMLNELIDENKNYKI